MGKKTDELGKVLETVQPEEISQFLNDNWSDMLDDEREFTNFMRATVKKNGLKWKDIYTTVGISEDYGQEVIGMRKHAKNRDLILRFCFAGRFNLDETQHALTLYGLNPLYSRNPRDAVLIVAINKRIYDLGDVDELLMEQNFERIVAEIE